MKDLIIQYLNEHKTREEICQLLGVSHGKFKRLCKEYEIDYSKPIPSKDELKELYINQNLSLKKLSKQIGIPKNRLIRILERYGIEKSREQVIQSQKESNLETYATGVPQKKIITTFINHYGTTHIQSVDEVKNKSQKTCLEKYGVDHYSKTEEYKEKFKQTSLERFGVEHPAQSIEVAEKMSKGINKAFATGIPQKHCIFTKHKNNSFNTSKPEEKAYELLLEHFSKEDVIRQYRSKDYPFACDFYIKSIDTYIEYQGNWTHGREPFDPNNPIHQKIINKWREKGTDYYNTAVDRWAVSDPEKRRVAKDNNLNWEEFFNLEDLENWLNK